MEVKELEVVEQTVDAQEQVTELDVSLLAKVAGGMGCPCF